MTMQSSPTVEDLIIKCGLPAGYRRIKWIDVKESQEVWLYDTYKNKGMAYGPHYVANKERRQLINSKHLVFPAPQEELLVKEMPAVTSLLTLANGAEPIAHIYRQNRNIPDAGEGIVLARWGEEYVVWKFWIEDGKGITEHGQYSRDIKRAALIFKDRVLREMGWNE